MSLVLITGAAIRIGRDIAIFFASKGWDIAVHFNSSFQEAATIIEDIKNLYNVNVELFQLDLSNSEGVSKLIDDVNFSMGKIDCLINNASVFLNDSIKDFSIESWDLHQKVNVIAPVILSEKFFQQLEKDDFSNIINITDSCILDVQTKFISYTLSKEALWSFTKKMALDFSPNVRVNSVALGNVLKNPKETDKHFNDIVSIVPLKKAPLIKEVAETIYFFINSPSVTGQMVILDSGKHLLGIKN